MRVLEWLAKLCAVVAGILLVVITLMTCASLLGRNTVGWTLVGDIELTAAAAGAAVALCLPWCQVKRSHIIVDFFTAKASSSTQAWMDRVGALMVAVVIGVLAWRTTLGGLSAWKSQSGSMMLGFPEWITYALIAPALFLAAAIALVQALQGFSDPTKAQA